MITAHKYLDLQSCMLRVSALIVNELQSSGLIRYDELLEFVVRRIGDDARITFQPSLVFLYAIGLIDYHSPPLDGVTLNETKQTILQPEV